MLIGATTKAQVFSMPDLSGKNDRIFFTDDGSFGECGLVTSQLHLHSSWADQVFACGPMAMYRCMANDQKTFKLEGKFVQVSLEMTMACGFGVCYGCTIKTTNGLKQVCKDGPVFDLQEVIW